ncbi:YciC family protein [Arsenophonus symbiont of Ornithomya chloropus]|uniref:YciC family protein n=1 Tax=Arsenophonus symbiont of Ornithomya chloropus TaxID=634121 RepID=UPI0032B20814
MYKITNTLISDSCNFFKNQFNGIFLLSFISATVSLILYYFFVPLQEVETIIKNLMSKNNSISLSNWTNQLSDEEIKIIMRVSLLSFISIFIGLILLVSSVLSYLLEITKGNHIHALQAFILSLDVLPRMIILLVICSIIIYFGFMFFILPGIIFSIGFSLSPIILITVKNIMPLLAITKSFKIAFRHWWLVLSILLFWVVLQIFITVLIGKLHLFPNIINNLISFTSNNLLTSFTLIYFFRLYMLAKK